MEFFRFGVTVSRQRLQTEARFAQETFNICLYSGSGDNLFLLMLCVFISTIGCVSGFFIVRTGTGSKERGDRRIRTASAGALQS